MLLWIVELFLGFSAAATSPECAPAAGIDFTTLSPLECDKVQGCYYSTGNCDLFTIGFSWCTDQKDYGYAYLNYSIYSTRLTEWVRGMRYIKQEKIVAYTLKDARSSCVAFVNITCDPSVEAVQCPAQFQIQNVGSCDYFISMKSKHAC